MVILVYVFGIWLRYRLGTWLRQVVDELHIHEVYS
jgi:hypothetical protein